MSYNTPVRTLQGGSVLEIASGGTLSVSGALTLGGTTGKWAFGTAELASGTVMVYTGLGQVQSAGAFAIKAGNEGTGAGTATSFQLNFSRAANGSVYFFGVTGTAPFAGAGTISWFAFGQ